MVEIMDDELIEMDESLLVRLSSTDIPDDIEPMITIQDNDIGK